LVNLQSIFRNQFKAEAKRGEFVVEGRIYPQELVMRVGYLENGRLKQVNFEASVDLKSPTSPNAELDDMTGQDSETMERVYVCIDALGSLMEEYLTLSAEDDLEEEMDVPDRWREFDFEGEAVFIQKSFVNTSLEAEADRLLGITDDRLFHEATEGEDALLKAEVDSDLAQAVQKLIREGKHPLQKPEPGSEN
jgi:hypothetical protein